MILRAAQRRAEIKSYISEHLPPDADGCASVDEILSRFSSRHQEAFHESNRFAYASIGLSIIYLVKVFGFRMDLIIFDQKILEIPYGIFFFCSLALISAIISCIRTSDAQVYDHYIAEICSSRWGKSGDLIYRSYIGSGTWLFNTSDIMDGVQGRIISKFWYYITATFFTPAALAIILLPIISGSYFLYDWKNQALGEYVNAQYYTILTLLIICVGFLGVIVITSNLNDEDASDQDDEVL